MKRLLLASAIMMMSLTPAHAAKKCSEFSSQSQAQAHYKKLKAAKKTGWKSLDRNKDGVACECLKTKTCSKGKKTATKTSNKSTTKKATDSKKSVNKAAKKSSSKVDKKSAVAKTNKKSKASTKKTAKKTSTKKSSSKKTSSKKK